MFVLQRSIAVRAFTPSALPDFFAIPALIPSQLPSVGLPLKVALPYSALLLHSSQELLLACLVASTSPCCSMPSATPRWSQVLVSIAPVSVACIPCHGLGHPTGYFGANYRIQRLTLHLRNLSSTPWFFVCFRSRVSVLSFSFLRRVPCYSMTRITHFDEDTGWLTTPFPRGLSPP